MTKAQPVSIAPALLSGTQAGQYLGMTTGALAQMRYLGTGPAFVKLGTKTVRYRLHDLDAWIESSIRTSTAR